MIDPLAETVLAFSEAARRLPRLRANRPVSPATLWRWAAHGVRGVKLETVRLGGRTCTSLEALRRFFAVLNGGEVVTDQTAGDGPPSVQRRLRDLGL